MKTPEQIARDAAEKIIGERPSYRAVAIHVNAIDDAKQIILAAINEAVADDIARRQAEVTTWLRTDYKSVPVVVLEVMAKMGCDFNKPMEPE